MTRYWLRCKSFEGLFPSEVGVMATTAAGKEFSLFVDRELVQQGEGEEVLVSVLGEPNGGEQYHIILPDEAFGASQCTTVNGSLIAEVVA